MLTGNLVPRMSVFWELGWLLVCAESLVPLQDSTQKPIPIMLCGNKIDLRQSYVEEGKTVISEEKGEKLAKVRHTPPSRPLISTLLS